MSGRILMIAGGTGGHIFPALAVARALRQDGFELQWLGSRVGMESTLVGDEFPLHFISIKAIRGQRFIAQCLAPFRLCLATWQAWRTIKIWQPNLVIGMGGFVSGPGALAARLARKPLLIHEQNAIAGMTNRFLSKYAQAILQGFPNAFPKGIAAETTGNPVRPAINQLIAPRLRFQNRTGPLRVLIVGGSRGARAINQVMIHALKRYPSSGELSVWHQTGHLDFETVQAAYQTIPVSAKVTAFIDNIAEAYEWADLLICRAGALTVSEIAVAGVPSLLVPFPYAVDDHQALNGNYLAASGAAELIRQHDLTEDRLIDLMQRYAADRRRLLEMAEKARVLAKPQALSRIVRICHELCTDKK